MSDEQSDDKMKEYFEDDEINKLFNPKVLAIIVIVAVIIVLVILLPIYFQSQADINNIYYVFFMLWLGSYPG